MAQNDYWTTFLEDEAITKRYLTVAREVREFAKFLKKHRSRNMRVLDIGFGVGRHTVYLSQLGFDVYGIDTSGIALKRTRAWLHSKGLKAHLRVHDMNEKLPYPDNFFRAVLSISTIHHTTPIKLRGISKEIERVLQPGGVFYADVPRLRRKGAFGERQKKIGYRTYMPIEGTEKGVPHFYFDSREARRIFGNFKLKIKRAGSRYYITATKR